MATPLRRRSFVDPVRSIPIPRREGLREKGRASGGQRDQVMLEMARSICCSA